MITLWRIKAKENQMKANDIFQPTWAERTAKSLATKDKEVKPINWSKIMKTDEQCNCEIIADCVCIKHFNEKISKNDDLKNRIIQLQKLVEELR